MAVEDSVKPASFQYHAPQTVEEAVHLLGQFASDDGRIIAGGQSLIPTMALRMARPSHLIDINGVGELEKLSVSDRVLSIGACIRHAAFHRPVVGNPLGDSCPSSSSISPTIRSECEAHFAEAWRMRIRLPNGR